MRKNIVKFLVVLMLFLYIIANISSVNAFVGEISTFDEDKEIAEVDTAINNIGGTIITIIRIASVAIAIVMLLVIGMRYMISAPGDRADLKKHAVAYVVGAFILFGVSGILTILSEFSSQIKLSGN